MFKFDLFENEILYEQILFCILFWIFTYTTNYGSSC